MKPVRSLLFLLLAQLPQPALGLPEPVSGGGPGSSSQLNHAPNNVGAAAAAADAASPRPPADAKYFQEPGGDNELGHYDARYFAGVVAYAAHRRALQHLVRSYLTTFRRLGLETWLAHGTLLGWWWNGRIMPWDYDLDVQVSSATLYYLATNLNGTTHEYRYSDDEDSDQDGSSRTGATLSRTYLLDVNPHHLDRSRGDGQNVIDARWIDTANGMFIDITGLAERDPATAPGIWSCKNYHRYRTRDLYPMRASEFEGVPATVPYSFDRILTEEYGTKSLVMTEWEGHRWEPGLKEWVKMPPPPPPPEGEAAPPRPTT